MHRLELKMKYILNEGAVLFNRKYSSSLPFTCDFYVLVIYKDLSMIQDFVLLVEILYFHIFSIT